MTATIDVEALSEVVLQGKVKNVAPFFDSMRNWMLGGVKEYATTVEIDQLPTDGGGLKPGMTAEVQVLVAELSDVLIVPIAAVAESEGAYYCFVVGPFGVQRRVVSIGKSNESFVEVREGIERGHYVLLDARRRLAAAREANQIETNGS